MKSITNYINEGGCSSKSSQDNESGKKTAVVWKYEGKNEQRKLFTEFAEAMRFQAGILKKKNGLEYAKYELNVEK